MTTHKKGSKGTGTQPKPRVIKATLDHRQDQERFDLLVQTSGLSQAEYIRRCCLEPELTVVPDCNIQAYVALGKLQRLLQQLLQQTQAQTHAKTVSAILQPLSDFDREQLQAARQELALMRLLVTGVRLESTTEKAVD